MFHVPDCLSSPEIVLLFLSRIPVSRDTWRGNTGRRQISRTATQSSLDHLTLALVLSQVLPLSGIADHTENSTSICPVPELRARTSYTALSSISNHCECVHYITYYIGVHSHSVLFQDCFRQKECEICRSDKFRRQMRLQIRLVEPRRRPSLLDLEAY